MASDDTIKKLLASYSTAETCAKTMLSKGYFSLEPYKNFLDRYKDLGIWFEAVVMMTNSQEEVDEKEALKLIEAYDFFNNVLCPALNGLSEHIISFEKLLEEARMRAE